MCTYNIDLQSVADKKKSGKFLWKSGKSRVLFQIYGGNLEFSA